MTKEILVLKDLVKSFGGLVAVQNVSFSAQEGEIIGLIGPNGAGKTTVFNLITGNYRPDSGKIFYKNQDITTCPTYDIVTKGIARTFQGIRLFQEMSVLENVLSGCHCRMQSSLFDSMFHTPRHKREEEKALEEAMRELAFVGLEQEYDNLAKNLSYGNQRLLEIARALATHPDFLILDEPAGGMNDQETLGLLSLIQAIQQRDITVLLIEHDMNLVMQACTRLVVLEYGAIIAEGSPSAIKKNPRVIEAYLGAD